jgi:hypothetical protein
MKNDTCEIGKLARFENALKQARADINDWVAAELATYRANRMQRIADKYNAEYSTSESMSPHTHMVMIKLAKKRGLGIPVTTEINDPYLGTRSKNKITAYFERVYPEEFLEYESDALGNLTQYVIL